MEGVTDQGNSDGTIDHDRFLNPDIKAFSINITVPVSAWTIMLTQEEDSLVTAETIVA
ncbi:hypothetical protein L195_g031509 [Trifolium pratense]|uniref:Uncharacterized protein n=1 Tax=Trifolium pratense TaxID=57577 RepID=A0A2K3LAK9_TRIPR|nr:hypothetical protein L195_g031509 [Trifolium pratense]